MTELTPQTPEMESSRHSLDRAVWAPIFCLIGGGLFVTFCNPTGQSAGDSGDFWQYLLFMAMGAIASQPLIWSVWGAWAPYPTKWRAPCALASVMLLAFLTCLTDFDYMLIGMNLGFLLVFWVGSALLRWFGGWRLTIGGAAREADEAIGVAYLMVWTTVVAVLLSLIRWLPLMGDARGVAGPAEVLTRLPMMLVVFGLMFLPAMAALVLVLGSRRRVLGMVLGLPLALAVCCAAGVWGMFQVNSISEPVTEVWLQTLAFSGGATLSMTLHALSLRWGGYRVTRGTC